MSDIFDKIIEKASKPLKEGKLETDAFTITKYPPNPTFPEGNLNKGRTIGHSGATFLEVAIGLGGNPIQNLQNMVGTARTVDVLSSGLRSKIFTADLNNRTLSVSKEFLIDATRKLTGNASNDVSVLKNSLTASLADTFIGRGYTDKGLAALKSGSELSVLAFARANKGGMDFQGQGRGGGDLPQKPRRTISLGKDITGFAPHRLSRSEAFVSGGVGGGPSSSPYTGNAKFGDATSILRNEYFNRQDNLRAERVRSFSPLNKSGLAYDGGLNWPSQSGAGSESYSVWASRSGGIVETLDSGRINGSRLGFNPSSTYTGNNPFGNKASYSVGTKAGSNIREVDKWKAPIGAREHEAWLHKRLAGGASISKDRLSSMDAQDYFGGTPTGGGYDRVNKGYLADKANRRISSMGMEGSDLRNNSTLNNIIDKMMYLSKHKPESGSIIEAVEGIGSGKGGGKKGRGRTGGGGGGDDYKPSEAFKRNKSVGRSAEGPFSLWDPSIKGGSSLGKWMEDKGFTQGTGPMSQFGAQFRHAAIWQSYTPMLAGAAFLAAQSMGATDYISRPTFELSGAGFNKERREEAKRAAIQQTGSWQTVQSHLRGMRTIASALDMDINNAKDVETLAGLSGFSHEGASMAMQPLEKFINTAAKGSQSILKFSKKGSKYKDMSNSELYEMYASATALAGETTPVKGEDILRYGTYALPSILQAGLDPFETMGPAVHMMAGGIDASKIGTAVRDVYSLHTYQRIGRVKASIDYYKQQIAKFGDDQPGRLKAVKATQLMVQKSSGWKSKKGTLGQASIDYGRDVGATMQAGGRGSHAELINFGRNLNFLESIGVGSGRDFIDKTKRPIFNAFASGEPEEMLAYGDKMAEYARNPEKLWALQRERAENPSASARLTRVNVHLDNLGQITSQAVGEPVLQWVEGQFNKWGAANQLSNMVKNKDRDGISRLAAETAGQASIGTGVAVEDKHRRGAEIFNSEKDKYGAAHGWFSRLAYTDWSRVASNAYSGFKYGAISGGIAGGVIGAFGGPVGAAAGALTSGGVWGFRGAIAGGGGTLYDEWMKVTQPSLEGFERRADHEDKVRHSPLRGFINEKDSLKINDDVFNEYATKINQGRHNINTYAPIPQSPNITLVVNIRGNNVSVENQTQQNPVSKPIDSGSRSTPLPSGPIGNMWNSGINPIPNSGGGFGKVLN